MDSKESHHLKVGDRIRYTPTPEMARIRPAGEGTITDILPNTTFNTVRYGVRLDRLSHRGVPIRINIYSDENTIEKLHPAQDKSKEDTGIKPSIAKAFDRDFRDVGEAFRPRLLNKYITLKLCNKDACQIDKLKQRGCSPALVTASAKDEVLITFKHRLADTKEIERLKAFINKTLDGKATPAATEIPKKSAVIEATGATVDIRITRAYETAWATARKINQSRADNEYEL